MLALPLVLTLLAQMFTPIGAMNVARSGHQATLLLDGRVLVSGGHDDDGRAIISAELYTPSSGTWSVTGRSLVARSGHRARLLPDGRVLVVGGVTDSSSRLAISTAEIYHPASGTWSAAEAQDVGPDHADADLHGRIGALITDRTSYTVTRLANGSVLIVGGSLSGRVTAAVDIYVPEP